MPGKETGAARIRGRKRSGSLEYTAIIPVKEAVEKGHGTPLAIIPAKKVVAKGFKPRPTLRVIPAKAGIHFPQHIPEFEGVAKSIKALNHKGTKSTRKSFSFPLSRG